MSNEILVALLSLTGTFLGTIAGILTSNKLVVYRLTELEKKVEKHNCLVERITTVEVSCKQAHKRIDDIKEHK